MNIHSITAFGIRAAEIACGSPLHTDGHDHRSLRLGELNIILGGREASTAQAWREQAKAMEQLISAADVMSSWCYEQAAVADDKTAAVAAENRAMNVRMRGVS